MVERLPPHNLEAEQSVLGSLLLDGEAVVKVASWLRPDDFYNRAHSLIYQAILDLYERREPVDFITLCEELNRKGILGEVGGEAYITSLINAVPTPIHLEHYAQIVERTATLRRLISAASDIASLAYDASGNVEEVVDKAEQIIFGVSQRRLRRDVLHIKQVLDEYFERIEYLHRHRGQFMGVPTGFSQLDKLLGGLQKSDFIVIAGRPGMGKSSFALSIAHNAAKRYGQRVAIFSLEMSAEQVVQRLLAAETGVDSQRLRLGLIKDEEWPRVVQAIGILSETLIFLDDTPAISAMELRAKARRLHAEHGLDLIIVDYLQLMQGDSRSENRVQEISYISRSLKSLARELNIPVIALSQLSRAVEQRQDKRPLLSDLRESGSIEQDSDVVMFVYREEMYNPETEKQNIAEIIVAKHRNGPTGVVPLYFRKEVAQFVEVELLREGLDFEMGEGYEEL